jgi:spore coat protein U-like protein
MFRARIATFVVLVAGALLMASSAAQAQTGSSPQTANMAVSATVVSRCSVTAGALDFGNYDVFTAANIDAMANLAVTCTRGAATTITLGNGLHVSGSQRNLAGPGTPVPVLPYNLYTDIARNTAWPAAGVAYTAADRASHNVAVYGRLTGGLDVPVGSYTDTVVVTVTF